MKKFISVMALVVLAGLAMPAMADADDSGRIAIGFYFPANNQGSFSMAGAGDAHGNAEVTSATVAPDGNGGSRITTTKVLHYPGGDVYMSTEGLFVPTPTTRESTGEWVLTGGTGVYQNVSGSGEYHWFRVLSTGILTGAYSGKIKTGNIADGVPKK